MIYYREKGKKSLKKISVDTIDEAKFVFKAMFPHEYINSYEFLTEKPEVVKKEKVIDESLFSDSGKKIYNVIKENNFVKKLTTKTIISKYNLDREEEYYLLNKWTNQGGMFASLKSLQDIFYQCKYLDDYEETENCFCGSEYIVFYIPTMETFEVIPTFELKQAAYKIS
jgi:hypothetical protein